MAGADHRQPSDVLSDLSRYVFRSTRHGRVGASFDIFNPRELPCAVPCGPLLEFHQYRIEQRHIADDATISIQVNYVGPTGRVISPTPEAIRDWSGLQIPA